MTLPDYQGIGLGMRVVESIADCYRRSGCESDYRQPSGSRGTLPAVAAVADGEGCEKPAPVTPIDSLPIIAVRRAWRWCRSNTSARRPPSSLLPRVSRRATRLSRTEMATGCPMAARGILDDAQRARHSRHRGVTGSRSKAAEYVGCTSARSTPWPGAIRFAAGCRRRSASPYLTNWKSINAAAEETRYWRAAAWALEHLYPEDYALRRPRSMSAEQISRALTEFAAMIVDDIVDETVRATNRRPARQAGPRTAAEPETEEESDEPR